MKKSLIAFTLAAPILASASNLVQNGSFEVGTVGEPGSDWTLSEGIHLFSPVQIQYFPHPGAAFGEDVPADDSASLSPDPVGEHGVYFVDDTAASILMSTQFVAPETGLYHFGFSAYAPANGYTNPGDSVFSLTLGAFAIGGAVSSLGSTTWSAQSGLADLVAGQNYNLVFSFTGGGLGSAKDMVVDRFYVAAVPEPGSAALMLAGLTAAMG